MSKQSNRSIMRSIKGFMLKHMHKMITCRQFEDFIVSYLDGTLPANQRKIFEWHLRICRECREYLVAFKRTVELGQAVFCDLDEPVGADVPHDLIKAVLDARRE